MLFNLKKKEASFKKTLCINHCVFFFYSENLFSSIHLLLTDCSTHGCSQSIGEVRCTPWTVHQSIAHASVRTYGQFSVRQTLSPVGGEEEEIQSTLRKPKRTAGKYTYSVQKYRPVFFFLYRRVFHHLSPSRSTTYLHTVYTGNIFIYNI